MTGSSGEDESIRNRLLLNYNDAVMYESDLQLLECPTAWLNDACMHFGMRRLYEESKDKDVAFMDPAVLSFLMHQCEDEEDMEDFLRGNPGLLTRKRILCPINDGHAPSRHWQRRTGTHWSLLIIECNKDNTHAPYHWDSVSGSNRNTAHAVAARFASLFRHGDSVRGVQECYTPQQSNGYDCGLCVLAEAHELASVECLRESSLRDVSFDVSKLRAKLAQDVRQFAQEYAQQHK